MNDGDMPVVWVPSHKYNSLIIGDMLVKAAQDIYLPKVVSFTRLPNTPFHVQEGHISVKCFSFFGSV